MLKFLKSERSRFSDPGPRIIPLLAFPNMPCAGCAKAAVLNQCAGVLWKPDGYGLPTIFARCEKVSSNPLRSHAAIETGNPDCRLMIPFKLQPPTIASTGLLA